MGGSEVLLLQPAAVTFVGGLEGNGPSPSPNPNPNFSPAGTLLRNVGEDELRDTANYTLSVTLSGDEWHDAIGEPCS